MCYNAAMKAALALLLCASPAIACDWTITKKPNPMTDATFCMVTSMSGKIAFYRNGTDAPKPISGSAYSRAGIYLRVDDREAIYIGPHGGGTENAQLLSQLKTGKRLRVRYDDYPHTANGDTEVCNLIELLDSCTTP